MVTASFDLFTRVRKFFFSHQKVDSGATNSGSPALATRLSDPDFLSVLRLKLSCCRCQEPPRVVTSATEPSTVADMTVCPGEVVPEPDCAVVTLSPIFPLTSLPHRPAPPLTFVEKPFQVCEDAAEIWQTGHELLLV